MKKLKTKLYIDKLNLDNYQFILGVTNKGLAYFLKEDEIDLLDFELVYNNDITTIYKDSLVKYFKGELKEFNLPLDLIGTNFQKSVWQILLTIPYGKAISYSDVAIKLGDIKKVRAVANAIGKNNILVIVPCHRIIGKNKKLTGFSSGLDLKEYLLKLEGYNNYLL
ncbi:MAG TPA: methylated-DNA--[protein]-cysteine S-methyltransferase [Haploplasma sp.]|nr:methylated-DNA--[protein]-cysteine S-methyltransferase [Haploplasma sp.]